MGGLAVKDALQMLPPLKRGWVRSLPKLSSEISTDTRFHKNVYFFGIVMSTATGYFTNSLNKS